MFVLGNNGYIWVNFIKMKKLLYLFLAITIASCSNTTPANSSNTLLLENNGFKLTFDEAGFKVNNTKGDYLILDADGIKMSKASFI